MKKWLLLFSMTLSICPFSWGARENQNWPTSIETIERNPLSYNIIKSALFNFEGFINESLNLKTQSCQYTSLRKAKTFNYSDTGACIYRLLLDSIYSKDSQNSVYIWAKTEQNITIQLKLDWRPQLNNFLEVYNQLFEMSFENKIHSINNSSKNPFKIDFEKRGFGSRTSLMGQISIMAKSSPENLNHFLRLFLEHPPENIQISGLSVDFSPNGRLKGYMNQNIKIKIWKSEETELTHFQISSNLNLLDPSRTFILKSTEIRLHNENP